MTLPLLAAVVDEPDVELAWRTLRGLPFTVTSAVCRDRLSGGSRPPRGFGAARPGSGPNAQARAARAILYSLAHCPYCESTADLLHLVQILLIRNAYAPPLMLQHPAEQARGEYHEEIVAIALLFAFE